MASVVEARSLVGVVSKKELREAALSMLVGVGIVFLMFLTRPDPFDWRLGLYGAINGLAIFLCCRMLHRLVGEPIPDKGILPRPLVAAVVFFVGGVLGWGLSTLLSQTIGLTRFRFSVRDIGFAFGVTGVLGLVIGLAFYSFGRMQDSLRQSVARLKETEFAEKELDLARAIQQRLLPPQELEGDGYRIAARNLAARFVAGDFYDVFRLADGSLGVAVADVSGKGMGAALIMASVKAVLPLLAEGRSAHQTLVELNRKLSAELAAREFVALAYARFWPASGRLELANAGLPDPYLLRDGRPPEPLSVPGPRLPLGARPVVEFESLQTVLAPGERLLFVTDGLPEAPTGEGDPLGYEDFARLLPAGGGTPAAWLDGLIAAVRQATRPTLEDDWTALLLEARGP
jgi:Stage II sporulation protein E (SpoIIE)